MSDCGVRRLVSSRRCVQDRRALALAAAAFALAGCSGDLNPVRDAFVATGIGGKARQAPDFVIQSRPETVDYVPVGVSAPARPIRAKTAAETKAAEQELDSVRAANEARAAEARVVGATPPPAPSPVPAQTAAPALRGSN
jgi:hypothetical protein